MTTEHNKTPPEFLELEEILKQTKLSSRELGPLFMTSNQTVLSWSHGAVPKQEVLRLYAVRVIRLLKKMIEEHELPLRDDVPQKDRKGQLQELWRRRLSPPAKREQEEG